MERFEQRKLRTGEIARIFPEPEIESRRLVTDSAALSATDQEVERLYGVVEDLKLSVEQAGKRISRLQGERSQLTRLLEKRDQQIQDLNRELGSLANRQQPKRSAAGKGRSLVDLSTSAFSFLGEKVSNWFGRLNQASSASNLPKAELGLSKNGKGPLRAQLAKGDALPVVIVLLLGLDENGIVELLPTLEKECRQQAVMPICVIDNDAFELFRTRSMIFEYLPPDKDRVRFDPTLHWDLYVQRRLALIRQKWQPIRTIAFGKIAKDTLELWSSSPFETTELPGVSGRISRQFDHDDKNTSGLTLQRLND